MKRPALIFIVAIFLPSLVLGWLALRTAGEQGILIEKQAADLYQAETDALAVRVRSEIEERQITFVEEVRQLVAQHGSAALAETYADRLGPAWTQAGVPFAIAPQGNLVFPQTEGNSATPSTAEFLRDNRAFLSNKAGAEIYTQQQSLTRQEVDQMQKDRMAAAPKGKSISARSSKNEKTADESGSSFYRSSSAKMNRNVLPQKATQTEVLPSKITPEFSDFQSAVQGRTQGILARFVQNDLQILFWTRPDPGSNWLFGVMVGPEELQRIAARALPTVIDDAVQIAIINDKARPVARVPADFAADWKRPFVATEIGEVLPHWEVALYLTNPGQITDSARLVALTLILLIALALAAILTGGYLVAADTRRQLALAQKKTDFVSNVSHELKTPLTSIRMFADLLAENRIQEPDKRQRYLRIIAGESERLTRLVNNVLDFARMEKGRKIYEMRETDLYPVIERIWESEGGRLREAGFATDWESAPGPYPMVCDQDAVAQILVNLIGNAEKYATRRRDITLRTTMETNAFCAEVLDRGPGIPHGFEEKIFEAFFRADDSLASGVQGSGLGLTLARRLARDHGGDLNCRSRPDGGTIFSLRLPNRPPVHP